MVNQSGPETRKCYIQRRPKRSAQSPDPMLHQLAQRCPPGSRSHLPELLGLPPGLRAAVKRLLPAWSWDERSTRIRLWDTAVVPTIQFTFGLAARWGASYRPRPQLVWQPVPGWPAGNLTTHEARHQSPADHRFCHRPRPPVPPTRRVSLEAEVPAAAAPPAWRATGARVLVVPTAA